MGVSRAVMRVKEGREKATTTTTTMVKVARVVEVEVTSSKVVVMVSRVEDMVVVTRLCWPVVLQQSCGDLRSVLNELPISARMMST